jgi:uncharacterized protein YjbJ (UPF0337 family)
MTTGSTNTSGGGLFSSKKNRNATDTNNTGGGGMFSGNNSNTTDTTGGRMMGGNTNTSGGGLFSSKKNRNTVGTNNTGGGGGMFNGNNANTTNTTGGGILSGNGQSVAGAAPVNSNSPSAFPTFSNINDFVDPSAGHASSTVTSGKFQEGVGKVLHSRSMQAKGAAKVQKGEQEKLSVGHLQEADRLEKEAVMRRGMAGVGQGVHTTAGNTRGGLGH